MIQNDEGARSAVDRVEANMMRMFHEPVPGQRWVSCRQAQTWCPPTDVYETDENIVVKVEIAGMQGEDLTISLDGKRLTIGGVRHDPAAKLVYQQMEIAYGQFESHVHLPRAVDTDKIEATYRDGFLVVRLPKAKARQVPVASR